MLEWGGYAANPWCISGMHAGSVEDVELNHLEKTPWRSTSTI
jgi:hypothetical protein